MLIRNLEKRIEEIEEINLIQCQIACQKRFTNKWLQINSKKLALIISKNLKLTNWLLYQNPIFRTDIVVGTDGPVLNSAV